MPKQLSASLSPAAMLVAVLALVLAGAGAGYTAATIGTSDLENGAVTSQKVKNGSLRAADMVKEKKFTNVGSSNGPNFGNGGEGDCLWASAHTVLPGVGRPSFRTDRFGTVHLAGVAVGADAPGGDADCNATAESADGVVFVLPPKSRPATTQVRMIGTQGSVVVAGREGLAAGSLLLPPGAVYWQGSPTFGVLLDGISYLPAGSPVAGRTGPGRLTPAGRAVLKGLGLG